MKGKVPYSSKFFSLLTVVKAVRAKDVVTLSLVALVLAVLEGVGRTNTSELADLGSAGILALVVATCVGWHFRLELAWTKWLVDIFQVVARRLSTWRFDWGLDLRRTPPLPRGVPPVMIVVPVVLAATIVLAITWHLVTGTTFRAALTPISYVAYLFGISLMWLWLAMAIVVTAIAPSWMFFDLLVSYTSCRYDTAQRVTWLARATFVSLTLVLSVLLPIWVASLVLVASISLAAILPWFPPTWHPDCLWRSSPDGPVRTVSFGTMFGLHLIIAALAPAVPIIFILRGEVIGLPAETVTAPLSLAVGRAAMWVCSCGLLLLFTLLGGHMFVSRWNDPARPAPLTLHVDGIVDSATKLRWRKQFAERGWRWKFSPTRPTRTDVCVQLAERPPQSEASPALAGKRSAILCTIGDFDDGEFLFRLSRRDQVQRRRLLVHGLETIFRRAARKKGRSGCGFWVAPQYWFIDGLSRDEFNDDDTSILEFIPPLFHQAIPRPARRHFFEIARALEIDMLFVEDGVGLRGLRRVLRVMFERFDVDGGREPLREIHFAGLPKIRVILHDYTLDRPWMHTEYPEPDYRFLGRVRILHIFRDRGADEELSESPAEPDWIFSPAGSL